MIVYQRVFFDGKDEKLIRTLEKEQLTMKVRNLHCTFNYRPSDNDVFDDIVGEEIELMLVGYGCDGNNSGFEVKIPEEMLEYYKNYYGDEIVTPHITTSIAKVENAFDTKDLDFEPFPEPYIIKGKYGYFIGGRSNSFISFEPQIDIKRIRKRK